MTTLAMFAGYDTSGNTNLWITDGTPAGRSELAVAGACSYGGLPPPDLTTLSPLVDARSLRLNGLRGNVTMTSRAVFSGLDARDHINLWVTDGTAAGTSELTPAGAYYYGLLDLYRLALTSPLSAHGYCF